MKTGGRGTHSVLLQRWALEETWLNKRTLASYKTLINSVTHILDYLKPGIKCGDNLKRTKTTLEKHLIKNTYLWRVPEWRQSNTLFLLMAQSLRPQLKSCHIFRENSKLVSKFQRSFSELRFVLKYLHCPCS